VELEVFESLVADAVDSLPQEFLDRMENVEVVVEEWPDADDLLDVGLAGNAKYALLGLYHGVPQTQRGLYYMALPDRISIYKGPIESLAGKDPEAIREQVRRTVIHEIAHHYGISDERLRELGWG
jgi:predicted Zn-dependent protease with MMP-like domain